MQLHISLFALLLAGAPAAATQEPPPGDGPRGSSQVAAGEIRYDAVGYAAPGELTGVSAASAALPVGSHAEITALDTGRTIVVGIVGGGVAAGRVLTLSAGAAAALGMTGDKFAVRVRKVTPTPQDVVQLRDGQAASFRAEAPPALLVALRKKLPPMIVAVEPTPKSTPAAKAPKPKPTSVAPKPPPTPVAPKAVPSPVAKAPAPKPTPTPTPAAKTPAPAPSPTASPATSQTKPATAGYMVQVAALSSAARAETVAKAVGGTVVGRPPVWRVRIGPFPDTAAATRARAEAARKGYPGGQITRIP